MPLHGPTPVGDIAAGVWSYLPNRRLTNLADGRAVLIDNLDVLLSSRLSKADFDTKIPDARALRIDNLDVVLSTRATPGQVAALLGNLDVAVSTRATPGQVAALLGNLDVAVSTRSTLTAVQVWAAVTRDLTKKVGSENCFVFPHAAPQVFNDVAAHDLTTLSSTITIPSGATLRRCPLAVLVDVINQAAFAEDIDIDVFFRKQGDAWGAAIYSENDVLSLPGVDRAPNSILVLADVFAIVNAGGAGVYEMKVTIQMSDAHNVQFVYQGLLALEVEGA